MANRNIFPLDKTELKDQIVFGNQQERSTDAGVDSDDLLPALDVHKVSDKVPWNVIVLTQDSSGSAYGKVGSDRSIKSYSS